MSYTEDKAELVSPMEEVKPKINILNLPRELRDMIVSMLPTKAVIAFRTSCHQLYHSGPPLALLYYRARKNNKMRYKFTAV